MGEAELWKSVEGFPYEVSCFGRVRRSEGGSNSTKPGRLLRVYADRYGYAVVRLSRHGEVHDKKIHRLVCEAFNGKPADGQQVRHLDGDPQNNHPANLVWGDAADNAADRRRHGRHSSGETSCRAKLSQRQVDRVRLEYESHLRERRLVGYKRALRGWAINKAAELGLSTFGLSTILCGRGYK
jgi:hypothetical protein